MRLLLDTHTLLWFLLGDRRTSPVARGLIEDAANDKLISIASVWEIAIKTNLGKLSLGQPFETFVRDQLLRSGFELLPITTDHLVEVSRLPLHHRDPFDRLLVAQSFVERMPLLSADAAFDPYGVRRLW